MKGVEPLCTYFTYVHRTRAWFKNESINNLWYMLHSNTYAHAKVATKA